MNRAFAVRAARWPLFVLPVVLSAFAGVARAEDYKVDAVHSAVLFRVKHMNVSFAYGRFNDLTGTVSYDAAAPEKTKFDVTVKTASVDTGNKDRDDHLRNPDFFDAEKYPEITFKSTAVKKKSDTELEVTGDLSLHGVTKSITVTMTVTGVVDSPRGKAAGFECGFTIKRTDYGMNKGLEGVADEVTLRVALECHKPSEKEAGK